MSLEYLRVCIMKAPGHLWYRDHIGQYVWVLKPKYYEVDHFNVKGDKHKIIFIEDTNYRNKDINHH